MLTHQGEECLWDSRVCANACLLIAITFGLCALHLFRVHVSEQAAAEANLGAFHNTSLPSAVPTLAPSSSPTAVKFSFTWEYDPVCPEEAREYFEQCQNNGKPGVGFMCDSSGGCGGNGDRLGGLTALFIKALDVCVPFHVLWDTHGVWELTDPAFGLKSKAGWDTKRKTDDVAFIRSRNQKDWGKKQTLYQANVKLKGDDMIREKALIHTEWFDLFSPHTALGCLPRLLLKPSELLQTSVDSYLQEIQAYAQHHGYSKLLGIHYRVGDSCVRRNDLSNSGDWPKMVQCALDYEQEVYGDQTTALFYFATDCQAIKPQIKDKLGSKVYLTDIVPRHTDASNDAEHHLEAWTEMMLLGASDRLVLSPYSGYGSISRDLQFKYNVTRRCTTFKDHINRRHARV